MALSLTLMLSACATTGPSLDPEGLIPAELTHCLDAPTVPERPAANAPRGDGPTAVYIADLRGAYKSCKSTVAAVAVRRAALDAQAFKAKPWYERVFKKAPGK